MKKTGRLLLCATLFLLMLVISACEKEPEEIVIHSEDSFYGSGFTYFECTKSGEYVFTQSGEDSAQNPEEEGIEWSVYILDSVFDDGVRYIPQEYECALTGDGTLFIEKGQYAYISCSQNEMTADAPAEGCTYTVGYFRRK